MKSRLLPGNSSFPGVLFLLGGFIPAAGVIAVLVFAPVLEEFVMEDLGNGKVLYLERFVPEKEFSISYTHSVNKSDITDRFTLQRDGSILLKESEFLSFGAGVATEPEGAGTFSGKGDRLEYTGINLSLPELRVFAGTEADHRFRSSEAEFRFLDVAAPQMSLRFGIRKLTLGELALYRIQKGVLHERRL